MKQVVAVVAHPDDEVLGVGGTLARHVEERDDVKVIVVCANTFRGLSEDVDNASQMAESMASLGIKHFLSLGFDDQKLETYLFAKIVASITQAVGKTEVDVWYTHWHVDLNRDHRIVNEAVQLIARPTKGRTFELLEFQTPSSTEYSRQAFEPDTWVNIKQTLNKKISAMFSYKSELQSPPLPRNGQTLRTLAAAVGSQVGLEAAESFSTVRRVK